MTHNALETESLRKEFGDNVAVPDLLAFNELYGRQFAIDLAAYRDRIPGLHRARGSQDNRDVPRLGRCHRNRDCTRRTAGRA